MDSIQITSGDQPLTFTSTELHIADRIYPYSGISVIRHSPGKNAYAFLCSKQPAAFSYGQKDDAVIRALMERIAEAQHLKIEVLPVPEVQAVPDGPDEGSSADAPAPKPRFFGSPALTGIEAGAAVLLLALGIYLFITV